jgi:HindVP restriction endonuclease
MNMPSLFGITQSNRDFTNPYYWGKNQFNSAFPVALACYMQSKKMPLVYVKYDSTTETSISEIAVSETFGSNLPAQDLYFSFESRFDAYRNHVHDEPASIDLVICNGTRAKQIRPIEIKLTTLPDNTTESLSDDLYGTELVIRSATTRYLALSIVGNMQRKLTRVREIFEPSLAKIRDWDNKAEMAQAAPKILLALETFLTEFKKIQTPLLMQPVWKTIGKSPKLAQNCLDIFVWSDFALTHLFLDSARQSLPRTLEIGAISRQLRAALRLSRFLYQASLGSKVHQAPIYDGMTYDNQNDKEFAISGTKSHALMTCKRLTKPLVTKDELKHIILGGGHRFLSPERRFDAILYFSTDLFEGAE